MLSDVSEAAVKLFWAAAYILFVLALAYFVLGFFRRKFGGNIIGQVAADIEDWTQPQ